ncbi:MAG: two-component sensor histidine kinase [Lewinellaceae bacterium]|nr:two-component sensor histidine kinase [Lewinellaceae bacterium]
MKKTILLLVCSLLGLSMSGQYGLSQHQIDSLTQLLAKATADTVKYDLHMYLGIGYQYVNPDRAVHELRESLKIARKIDHKDRIMGALLTLGFTYSHIGEPVKSIEMHQEVLQYMRETKGDTTMALAFISENYEAQGDLANALDYSCRSFSGYEKAIQNGVLLDERGYPAGPMRLGQIFHKMGQLDSAMHYARISYQRILEKPDVGAFFYCSICNLLGNIHSELKQPIEAIRFYRLALNKGIELNYLSSVQESQTALSKFYQKNNQPDSAIYYAAQAYEGAKKIKGFEVMQNSAGLLRSVYENLGNFEKALFYNDLAIAARDSVSGAEKVREVQNLTHREERRQQLKQQAAEAAQAAFKSKVKIYSLLAVLGGVLLLAFVLYRNNQQKQRANALLQTQKEEIETQKIQLQSSLETLKSTQAQLIQSEKLASLGELTAGIAHEIQNPLNFVNNFSELSVDLANEIKEEIDKIGIPEKGKAYMDELLTDLAQNQQKINHHGKRAAGIVSGMLQHARTSTGTKESTDLNTLADEYLRLSYHGLRAKDPNFNATMITNFDPAIGMVNVIPQDMGRVLLNLINNAFYAVAQKKNQNLAGYEPKVTVSSRRISPEMVEIRIKDNGTGIPDSVKEKIFQPFFTTKPTGQGTGLGLSLAYDIVTKGHGGTMKLESREGEGTEFIIRLPG